LDLDEISSLERRTEELRFLFFGWLRYIFSGIWLVADRVEVDIELVNERRSGWERCDEFSSGCQLEKGSIETNSMLSSLSYRTASNNYNNKTLRHQLDVSAIYRPGNRLTSLPVVDWTPARISFTELDMARSHDPQASHSLLLISNLLVPG
jgi:hypothetical protein